MEELSAQSHLLNPGPHSALTSRATLDKPLHSEASASALWALWEGGQAIAQGPGPPSISTTQHSSVVNCTSCPKHLLCAPLVSSSWCCGSAIIGWRTVCFADFLLTIRIPIMLTRADIPTSESTFCSVGMMQTVYFVCFFSRSFQWHSRGFIWAHRFSALVLSTDSP